MSDADTSAPPRRLRRHQRAALDALDAVWSAGRRRAWAVLPPGAGKTLVGVETARRMLSAGTVARVLVLGPNTAIQAQWLSAAQECGVPATANRSLGASLTALTYQAVAVFDPDAEVGDDPEERDLPRAADAPQEASLLERLHPHALGLLDTMRRAGPLLLVLDECHHLLEVWGRLLEELLAELPQAWVLGLTATPPTALTAEEAALVSALFGDVAFETSIPAVVREGDLAPFAELAWLTEPTAEEEEWLAAESTRFAELVHRLTAPDFGSIPFLSWLDARFVAPVPGTVSWLTLTREHPRLCSAALRMHQAGLLDLPAGARLTEEHRRPPAAEDWVLLLDDWLRHLASTGDPVDEDVVQACRAALPAVGYQWTRRGIRRGRSPVDRVVARSLAKTRAAVEIIDHEQRALGGRLRALVLCDHERATSTLPVDLEGVIDQQSGSAVAVLEALVTDPATAGLSPLLVTGRTVAGHPETLRWLLGQVARTDPGVVTALRIEPLDGVQAAEELARIVGPWSSRSWVGHVTRFFEAGGSRVLVGTRGLLGEGWDARRVTGLVDLTAATTPTAVVQTRGRALRVDPSWPEKVAVTWSVVCVSARHPTGDTDWRRLVRKHTGFFGADQDGSVVDGVAHLDPHFSPYAPPAPDTFDAVNARMVVRAERRAEIAARWRVGTPYDDRAAQTLRVVPADPRRLPPAGDPPAATVTPGGLQPRAGAPAPPPATGSGALAGLAVTCAAFGAGAAVAGWRGGAWLLVPAVLLGLGALLLRGRQLAAYLRSVAEAADTAPAASSVAAAVAEALHTVGLVSRGADAVAVEVDPEGGYRCVLTGVPEEESRVFVETLDEALGPIATPRYVLPRPVVAPGPERERSLPSWLPPRPGARHAALRRVRPAGMVWHPVPTVLGVNGDRATAYARAWDRWVGGGEPVYTGTPEGAGVLAAQQGADPFSVTSVIRRHWS